MNAKKPLGAVLCLAVLLAGCSSTADTDTDTENTSASETEEISDADTSDSDSTSETSDTSDTAESITFTDDLGYEVTVEKPEKVAAMIGSFADMWVIAGGKDTLVAAAHDTWTSFDLDLDDSVADLGEIKSPNTEILLASEPDLVIASAKNDSNKDLKETLDAAGIPAAYFDVSSFDDYLRVLKIMTELTGEEENYQLYGTDLEDRIEAVKEYASEQTPVSVLYIRSTGSSVSAKNSEGSVLGEMLEDLNTENIADSDTGLMDNLSIEAIIQDDPEYIFIVYQGSDDTAARENLETSLLSNPAWSSLSAVENDKVFVLDQSLYNLKPNDRWADAYENLAKIIYGYTPEENQ